MTPTVRIILKAVAEHSGFTVTDLKSQRRERSLALWRHVAMYLARELTELSLPQIGRMMGGRDHTTVLHAIHRISEAATPGSSLAAELDALRPAIRAAALLDDSIAVQRLPDLDPMAIADRVLASRHSMTRISVEELVTLATAYQGALAGPEIEPQPDLPEPPAVPTRDLVVTALDELVGELLAASDETLAAFTSADAAQYRGRIDRDLADRELQRARKRLRAAFERLNPEARKDKNHVAA